jgi:hypothetical protein
MLSVVKHELIHVLHAKIIIKKKQEGRSKGLTWTSSDIASGVLEGSRWRLTWLRGRPLLLMFYTAT